MPNQVRVLLFKSPFQSIEMKCLRPLYFVSLFGMMLFMFSESKSQSMYQLTEFPPLPDKEGMAGMFAGVSKGRLFCMGGANFPDKKPWEGGRKIWYDAIFMYTEKAGWVKLSQTLPAPLAYGVSISFGDEILLIGGNNETSHTTAVFSLCWNGDSLTVRKYPDLPLPLANTAGARIGNLVMIAGGTDSFSGTPQAAFLGFDLSQPDQGWFELPAWPGGPRMQAVAGVYKQSLYLFSGEGPALIKDGKPLRNLLKDAYCFTPKKSKGKWQGSWERLPDLPKSVSASASPVPLLNDQEFFFWGGVDADATQHTNPAVHPGLGSRLVLFDPAAKKWTDKGSVEQWMSRVTLPSVQWKKSWLFISGEIKPGIRTNSIIALTK